MDAIHFECSDCLAVPFCRKYAEGKTIVPGKRWCSARGCLYTGLRLSNIPKRYWTANKYNYRRTACLEQIYSFLVTVADDIVGYVERGENIILLGATPGSGKTYNGCVLLNHFIYKYVTTSAFNYEDAPAYFITYPELCSLLRALIKEEGGPNAFISFLTAVPLLLIDDVGTVPATDYLNTHLFTLFNKRYSEGRPTIITSNAVDVTALASPSLLGSRVTSRLMENGQVLLFPEYSMRTV